jgi:hypothetical protein
MVALLVAAFSLGLAVRSFAQGTVVTFTGCLDTKGTLSNVALGATPVRPCNDRAGETQVSWSNGDILAVTAGTGLTGGGVSGEVTLAADTTALQRRVGGTCLEGASIRVVNTDGSVVCEQDNDTTYSPGPGLLLNGTQFSVNFAGTGSADTVARSDHTHASTNANAWLLTGNSGTNPSLNFVGTTDTQPLVFKTNNAEAMRITTAVNVGEPNGVGIGTTNPSPGFPLHIANQGFGIVHLNNTVSGGNAWELGIGDNGLGIPGVFSLGYEGAPGSGLGGGHHHSVLALAPTGNVGIGTTNPAQKLTVAGVVESTAGGFRFPDGTVQTTAAGNGLPGYELVSTSINVAPGTVQDLTVPCPAGKKVLGGGFNTDDDVVVFRNQPNADGTAWETRASNPTEPQAMGLTVTAICATVQ